MDAPGWCFTSCLGSGGAGIMVDLGLISNPNLSMSVASLARASSSLNDGPDRILARADMAPPDIFGP